MMRPLKDWWSERQAYIQAGRDRFNRVDRYVREHQAEQIDRLVMNVFEQPNRRSQPVTLHLFPDRIAKLAGPGSEIQMIDGVTASAELVGNHSWAGDDRQVFITIAGPGFAWTLAPDVPALLVAQSIAAARAFVASVNLAARRPGVG